MPYTTNTVLNHSSFLNITSNAYSLLPETCLRGLSFAHPFKISTCQSLAYFSNFEFVLVLKILKSIGSLILNAKVLVFLSMCLRKI